MKVHTLSTAEYKQRFAISVTTPTDLAAFADRALVAALDTRKFEITLYWQRTAYLWAMIAAAFAGYFTLGAAKDKSFAELSIACVGFVLSLAWYRLNQGSKFWQENWEQHVALLEADYFGPLFSTVLYKTRKAKVVPFIAAAAPISVSKVNLFVSLYVAFVWLVLIAFQLLPFSLSAPIDWYAASVVLGSALVSVALVVWAQTSTGPEGVSLYEVRNA